MARQPDYRHKGDDVKRRVKELIRMGTSTANILKRISVSKSYIARLRKEMNTEAGGS